MKLHHEIAQAACSCCSVVSLLGPSVLSLSATNFLLVSSLSFLSTNLLWQQQCSAHCTTALLLRNHFHRSQDHTSFLSHIPRRVSLGNQNACSYRPKSMVTAHIHLQTEKSFQSVTWCLFVLPSYNEWHAIVWWEMSAFWSHLRLSLGQTREKELCSHQGIGHQAADRMITHLRSNNSNPTFQPLLG